MKTLFFFFSTLYECLSQINMSRKSTNKILLCGSSHAQSSFVPEMASNIYSVTFASQDLDAALKILKFYHQIHKIERFAIFLSVFSPGFHLIKSKEHGRMYALRFALIISLFPSQIFMLSLTLCYIIVKIIPNKLLTKNKITNVEHRISRHINYGKMRDSMVYLSDIINYCQSQQIRLFFVLSPASRLYREQCKKHIMPFGYLDELTSFSDEIKIIDLFNTDQFDNGDWEDSDHLHVGGSTAAQVTREILERISI